jgi:hypothetical protein
MEIINNFGTSLHEVLKILIQEKSKRDKIVFTASQLAAALGMPRSMITKLTHQDKSKRVTNPRIDTLLKIVDFFKADGFQITIEDLLGIKAKTIEIDDVAQIKHPTTISLYELDNKNKKLGTINIELAIAAQSNNLFALQASRDIKPFFKTGSIFIIDKGLMPENDTLVAVQLDASHKIQIKKYYRIKSKTTLKSLDASEKDIVIMPTTQYKIIGIVIHANVKT